MNQSSKLLVALGFAAFAVLGATAACAQTADFPNKAITILVPFPAGGVSDQVARGIGQKMGENLKVPVVIENKPGGGAQVAAGALKLAAADGYTLLMGDMGALALNPSLYSKLSYDPLKDFTPLARVVAGPGILVVPPNSPYRAMADLVAASKSRPEGLTIASQGVGAGGHLFVEMLREQTHGKFLHVPYRGSGPALADVMGAQVDAMFDSVLSAGPLVKEGKLKALAIGLAERSPQFPQVPTLDEQGYGQVNVLGWWGVVAKAGTPGPLVERLSAEVLKALGSADVAKRFTDFGLTLVPLPSKEFKAFMEADGVKWNKVIKAAGIQLE